MKLRKRTLQSGKKVYYLHFKVNGKRYSVSTKENTKQNAEVFAKSYHHSLSNKISSGMSLKEFRDEYLRRIDATHTYSSWKVCKSVLKIFLEYFGEETSINQIDPISAEQFILQTFKRTKHGASLNLRTLKAAFHRGVDWNFVKANPFDKIKLPKIPEKLPSYLTDDQFDSLIKKVKDEKLKEIYLFAFKTGMRLSEILTLEWTDVDLETKTVKVSIKTNFVPKGKKERHIPLSDSVYQMLKNSFSIRSNNFVFTKKDGSTYKPHHVSKRFKKAVKSSKLDPRLHFHSLRHSFCSNLINKGANIYVIQKLAGHSSVSVTQRYAHVNRDALVNAVNLLN